MAGKKDSAPRIRFESLDGTPDDEGDPEFVDPLDAEPGERGAQEEEPDPRANDPFAEPPDDDEDAQPLKPLRAGDDDPPDDAAAAAAATPAAADPDDLRGKLAEAQRRIDELEAKGRLTAKEADESSKALREAKTKEVDGSILSIKAALRQAVEEGEVDKQIDLNERLVDLIAAKRELAAAPVSREAPAPAAAPQPVQANPQTPAAERWMKGKAWINQPAYQDQTADLIKIAGAMSSIEGYDSTTDGYYAELERRMQRRHPALFPTAPAANGRAPARQQQVARVTHDNPPAVAASRRTMTLTAEDQRNMMRFGLEPRNKDHVREFLRNKIADPAPRA